MKRNTKKLTQEEAVFNLKALHPTLDFSEFKYINNKTKSTVIHPDGRKYLLHYKHLLRGITTNYNKTTEDLLAEIDAKFPDSKCDYSKVNYTGVTSDITIICPIHGEFITTPNKYLGNAKYSCPQCGVDARAKNQYDTRETFIIKAKEIYGDKYDYSKVVYLGSKIAVEIIHGDHSFWQTPNQHLFRKSGCNLCSTSGTSDQEKTLIGFIESLGINFISNNRTLIKPLELDIVLPDHKIAIEYNGLYYHSEIFNKDKNYHLNKTNLCANKGYRLIHVFEDEWICKTDIVKSRLKHILGLSDIKLFARKLKIRSLSKEETNAFLERTHIQGSNSVYSHSYGLFNGDDLVSCMTFCKSRFGKENAVELLRFSSKYSIVGGFSKLLKHFIKNNTEIKLIVSYSDKRWSVGEVYAKNGFSKVITSEPGYDYVGNSGMRRYNRQSFMKHKLPNILKTFDSALTEVENCNNNGFYRIWNCGMDKWLLKVS